MDKDNFIKINADKFSASLSDAFGKSQQIGVSAWLINHANSELYVIATQREIAAELGASVTSVTKIMNSLQVCNPPFVVRKGRGGVYKLNPEIFKTKFSNNREDVEEHEKDTDTFWKTF